MKTEARRQKAPCLLLGLLCLLWFSQGLDGAPSGRGTAVVVHPDTPVSSLSLTELRKIFLGQRQYWSADVRVFLFVHAPTAPEGEVVLRVIYEMTERKFKQYWMAKVFRAQAVSPPRTILSNDAASQVVAAIPGAIALMDAGDVPLGLKVLRVDGRLPGEAGYPLP